MDESQEKSRKARKSAGMNKTRTAKDRISDLRKDLGQTQVQFANSLDVTQPMVSAWEGGNDIPSTGAYMRLGNLASYPDNLWFWEKAGMNGKAMQSAVEKLLKEHGASPVPGEVIRIPLIRKAERESEDTGRLLTLPAECVPNPGSTVCLIVDESAATQWVPTGDLIVLDTSNNEARDLSPFWDQIVLIDLDLQVKNGSFQKSHIRSAWPGKLLMGRLRCKQLRNPSIHARSAPLPVEGSMWVATVGLFGDSETEWQFGDKEFYAGHWSPFDPELSDEEHTTHIAELHKLASSSSRDEFRTGFSAIEARTKARARAARGEDDFPATQVEVRKLALSKIRLEPSFHILGRVIAWFGPSVTRGKE